MSQFKQKQGTENAPEKILTMPARCCFFTSWLIQSFRKKKKTSISIKIQYDSPHLTYLQHPTATYGTDIRTLQAKKKVCLHVDSNKETTSDGCGEKREPTSSQYDIFKTEQLMGEAGRKEEKSQ